MRVVLVSRVSVVVGLLLAMAPIEVNRVHAASNTCNSLRKQLVAVSSGRDVSQRSSRSAQQQSLQLQQMRARASKAGCGGFLFSRGDPALCKRYAQSIERMSARVARQQATSDRTRVPSRQQILASMNANGCNGSISARNSDEPSNVRRKSLFEVLFGDRDPSPSSVARPPVDERSAQRNNRLSAPDTLATTYEGSDPGGNVIVKKGGYRTLCVRTCDGYYFPISFSSQPRNFPRDQNACTAMCPNGTAAVLSCGAGTGIGRYDISCRQEAVQRIAECIQLSDCWPQISAGLQLSPPAEPYVGAIDVRSPITIIRHNSPRRGGHGSRHGCGCSHE